MIRLGTCGKWHIKSQKSDHHFTFRLQHNWLDEAPASGIGFETALLSAYKQENYEKWRRLMRPLRGSGDRHWFVSVCVCSCSSSLCAKTKTLVIISIMAEIWQKTSNISVIKPALMSQIQANRPCRPSKTTKVSTHVNVLLLVDMCHCGSRCWRLLQDCL